ncbi:MAG: hypothetical protein ABII97_01800 [Patescibacteria group bacterium]
MPKQKRTLHSLRTLKSDTSDVIKKGGTSLATIFVRQQKEKPFETRPIKTKENKTMSIIILSFLFLVLVGFALYLFVWRDVDKEPESVATEAPKPILFSQESIQLVVTEDNPESVKKNIKHISEGSYRIGDLIYIPLKKLGTAESPYLTSAEFLGLLTNAPVFLTTFLEDNFFLGVLVLEKNHPLLILEIKEGQHNNAFAGMLRWEENLLKDFEFIADKEIPTMTPVFFDK